jgi:hypothetical protein
LAFLVVHLNTYLDNPYLAFHNTYLANPYWASYHASSLANTSLAYLAFGACNAFDMAYDPCKAFEAYSAYGDDYHSFVPYAFVDTVASEVNIEALVVDIDALAVGIEAFEVLTTHLVFHILDRKRRLALLHL